MIGKALIAAFVTFGVIVAIAFGMRSIGFGQEYVENPGILWSNDSKNIADADITEMYLNNSAELKISGDNPAREKILMLLKNFRHKEAFKKRGIELLPEIVLETSDGNKYEVGFCDARSEGVPEEKDSRQKDPDTFLYIKCGENNASYYEYDDDGRELIRTIRGAGKHEFKKIGSFCGIVTSINDGEKKYCGFYSEAYGTLSVCVPQLDTVILGDTVNVKYTGDNDIHNCFDGLIENVTQNDVTLSDPGLMGFVPFEYEVLKFPEASSIRSSLDIAASREDLDLMLFLWEDKVPADILETIGNKYDDDFFEENILLYGAIPESEITAAAQTAFIGIGNLLYAKEKSGDSSLILAAVPKDEWNGDVFSFYRY